MTFQITKGKKNILRTKITMLKELKQNENHASPNSDGYFKGNEIAQTQPNRP